MTRRALLGAGALLVAGCGPPDEPKIDRAEVLNRSLRAAQAAAAAHDDQAARARVALLEAAVREAGGTPVAASAGGGDALAAEQEALRVHVAAVGLLRDASSRELLAGLIAGTAEAVARLDKTSVSFPGQPLNPR